MAQVTLKYSSSLSQSDPNQHPVCIIGQLQNLQSVSYEEIRMKIETRVTEETWKAAVNSLHPSPTASCPLWVSNATVAALPTKCSRHNAPSRSHSLTKIVKSFIMGGDEFFVIICERRDVYASACAVARAFPLYTRKNGGALTKRTVRVEFLLVGAERTPLADDELGLLHDAAHGIRLAAKIVDMPCSEMNTDAFLEEVKLVGTILGITPKIIRGKELDDQGFGGLFSVGKAAVHPPALAILSHTPEGASKTVAWVGKGIVYDTGGLCIKGKTAMPGMKRDCGGAAGILGAFYTAVRQGFNENLHALFCLAENAVGPEATRPDDIIRLYSGRTVEVDNTDAEGRLVLGDGVAYAYKDLKADIILDMATLTGAQGIATGKVHAAMLTNNEDWEPMCVRAGLNSGDLIHPMPYTPEIHFNEFASAVADMKNSVADRSNAQVSCAGLFIGAHIGFDYPGTWIHVDMAYPVHVGERATGYGVALLTTLFGQMTTNPLLRAIAPLQENGLAMNSNENASASKKIRLQ
ncbi:putative aminopeptidase NPEPL1 isoform X2 [Tubulanus polymorphus]